MERAGWRGRIAPRSREGDAPVTGARRSAASSSSSSSSGSSSELRNLGASASSASAGGASAGGASSSPESAPRAAGAGASSSVSESDPPKTSLIRSSFAIACARPRRGDACGCAAKAAATRAEGGREGHARRGRAGGAQATGQSLQTNYSDCEHIRIIYVPCYCCISRRRAARQLSSLIRIARSTSAPLTSRRPPRRYPPG